MTKSATPVAQALNMPRPALASRFGESTRTSGSFDEPRDRYRALVAGGVDAGRFAPEEPSPPDDLEAWQRELVGTCRDVVRALAVAAGQWDESDFDRYQIPHPLLGNLTVREMLFFTLYHHGHHQQNVSKYMSTPLPPAKAPVSGEEVLSSPQICSIRAHP